MPSQEQKKKELEELDAILSELNLATPAKDTQPEPEGKSKRKKKREKKNTEAESAAPDGGDGADDAYTQ